MTTTIQTVNPASFGPALAPLSQATVANGLCFLAGQVAVDADGQVIAPGDVTTQTTVVLERIETILGELDASLANVVTATVFLVNVEQAAAYNAVWERKFGDHRPARTTVRADLLFEGLVVEIQAIAAV